MNLEDLFNLKDLDSIKKYVDSVIMDIVNNTEHEDKVGFEHILPHKGFIDSDTIITNVDSTFQFTSNEYAYFFVSGLIKNNIHDLNTAMNCVYYFIRSYFGIDGEEKNREALFAVNKEPYSIDILRGKNAAVCAERAAVAQNLFSLLGIESYYIVGTLNGGAHAYNVIKYNDNYYLFDSSSDVPVYQDGKVKDWRAYAVKISPEQFNSLLNAGGIELEGDRIYISSGKYNGSLTK